MKQSVIFDYAMQGIIVLMQNEPDEDKKQELNQVLKELAMMFVLAEREEREQQYLSCLPQSRLEELLDGLELMHHLGKNFFNTPGIFDFFT